MRIIASQPPVAFLTSASSAESRQTTRYFPDSNAHRTLRRIYSESARHSGEGNTDHHIAKPKRHRVRHDRDVTARSSNERRNKGKRPTIYGHVWATHCSRTLRAAIRNRRHK